MAKISEGLRTSLNAIRETSVENNTLYAKQIDIITPTTDITALSSKLFEDDNLMNEFMNVLVKRIVYTQIVDFKLFNNPLKFLEGEQMPLGAIGQELFINPVEGRDFNVDDFAGLLSKYEADVKVQYPRVNSDKQYPVTITRDKLRNAFASWSDLESFVDGLTQSLYNGAYIDRYNFTKGLVTDAYLQNAVQMKVISKPSTESQAKAFITEARTLYLNMQEPTPDYNAWRKVGGYGRDVLTWTDPEDIVFLIRNDLASYIDVNVLASLLGRIKYVQDFSVRDKSGNIVKDGSNILGIMADKKWFRIKNQETKMDEFYNANNRTWQMYLNDVNMYQFSLFCNAMLFVTQEPQVTITGLNYNQTTPVEIHNGDTEGLEVITTPLQANYPEIQYEITEHSDGTVASVEADKNNPKIAKVTAKQEGTCKLKATAGNVSTTIDIKVVASL